MLSIMAIDFILVNVDIADRHGLKKLIQYFVMIKSGPKILISLAVDKYDIGLMGSRMG